MSNAALVARVKAAPAETRKLLALLLKALEDQEAIEELLRQSERRQ